MMTHPFTPLSKLSLFAFGLALGFASSGSAIAAPLSAAPTSRDALETARRVADWQLFSGRQWVMPTKEPRVWQNNEWGGMALWAGVLEFYQATGDKRYLDALMAMGKAMNWKPRQHSFNADYHAIGQVYLDLYRLEPAPEKIAPTRSVIDEMLVRPGEPIMDVTKPGGKEWWSWADALFMSPPVLCRLSDITGDRKYFEFSDRHWWQLVDLLYDQKEHLIFRDLPAKAHFTATGEKVFWSRGNGWVFAALPRVIPLVPSDAPSRARYERMFREMAERLVAIQGDDGLWTPSLLDRSGFPQSETSGSAFFCYGLAWGVNSGLLDDPKYRVAAERAWAGLAGQVRTDGRLAGVQPVGSAPTKFDPETTDIYGVGAFLLAASEMSRLGSAVKANSGVNPGVSAPVDGLARAKRYVDALLARGRDTYGPRKSPLVVTCMDLKDFRHIPRDDPRLKILTEAGYRPKDTLFRAADPHLEENFYQILYALSAITGERRYQQEADTILAEFFRVGQNPRTGLFAWGEHMGIGFDDEQVQNGLWLRGGRWAKRFEGRPIHEFYRPWVLWPQTFKLDEARSLKFARGLWDYQIYEHTGDFSRHAGWDAPNPDPSTGSHFPRHAGFYIATWAHAYQASRDEIFLKAIRTQLDFYDGIRNPALHFLPDRGSGKEQSLEKNYAPSSNLSLVIDLQENAHLLAPDVADRMRQFARRELELFLKLTSDRPAVAGWKAGYGDVSPAGTGVMIFTAARSCPDSAIARKLVERGLVYAQAYLDGDPATATWLPPGNVGQAILLMLEAFEQTGRKEYLDKARTYARFAADTFLDGTDLPRALKGADFYHAMTRGDTLMLALLKLWAIEKNPGAKILLEYTDR